MKKCRFDGTEMDKTIRDFVRFKIIEYRCSTCGHYWFRKGLLQTLEE